MSTILSQVASPTNLNAAWRRLRTDKAYWRPSISRSEMERNLLLHLLTLAQELETGTFRPDQVRFFPVAKGDGGQRIISSHFLRDKLGQRALLSILTPIAEQYFHHDSFGYRPGRSIDMALARVRQFVAKA